MSVLESSATTVITILCLVGKYEATDDNIIKIDDPIESVLCQPHFNSMLKCTNQGVLLRSGHCATFEEGKGIFIARCPYFLLNGHNVTEMGYIRLPDNISELNDYMCGPMNRKGLLCKDCIDGFGPSVTSLGYKCSNCTDAWYGIPLYLAVELIPITLFYLIILIFKVHLTSAPMTLIILYCHILLYMLLFEGREPMERLLSLNSNSPLLVGMISLLEIWNLDFIRYIAPPFCVNSRLLPSHIEILDYITNFYPLFLILVTIICVDLHGRNFRPLVWIWRPLHNCFVRFRRKWDIRNDIIDVFASFFLLFYIKLLYLGAALYKCYTMKSTLKNSKHVCTTIDGCFSRPKYAYIVIPFILAFNILPVLLLVLYPFKLFRRCLSKCKLDRLFVITFIEKFHGCYRDGLDGGKDMRSFCGLYFLLIILMTQAHTHFLKKLHISVWLSYAFIFLIFSLLIALIQPYKNIYINVLDSLLLAHLTVVCLLLSRDYFPGDGAQIFVMMLLPVAMFGLFVVFKIFSKCHCRLQLVSLYKYCCKRCKQLFKYTQICDQNNSSRQLVNPAAFFEDNRKYGTFSEVSIQ